MEQIYNDFEKNDCKYENITNKSSPQNNVSKLQCKIKK